MDQSSLYLLDLPPHLEIPAGTSYSLEIRLEWVRLVGAQNGMVCGDRNMTCDPLIMVDSIGDNVNFIGNPLEIELDDKIIEFEGSGE